MQLCADCRPKSEKNPKGICGGTNEDLSNLKQDEKAAVFDREVGTSQQKNNRYWFSNSPALSPRSVLTSWVFVFAFQKPHCTGEDK